MTYYFSSVIIIMDINGECAGIQPVPYRQINGGLHGLFRLVFHICIPASGGDMLRAGAVRRSLQNEEASGVRSAPDTLRMPVF